MYTTVDGLIHHVMEDTFLVVRRPIEHSTRSLDSTTATLDQYFDWNGMTDIVSGENITGQEIAEAAMEEETSGDPVQVGEDVEVYVDHGDEPETLSKDEFYALYLYGEAQVDAIDAGLNWYGYGTSSCPRGDSTISTAPRGTSAIAPWRRSSGSSLCSRCTRRRRRRSSWRVRRWNWPARSGPWPGRRSSNRSRAKRWPWPSPCTPPASRRPGQEERPAGGRRCWSRPRWWPPPPPWWAPSHPGEPPRRRRRGRGGPAGPIGRIGRET